MTLVDGAGLAVALALIAYLTYALLRGENL
jgi:K+-transporting ATPase KdpF subunit